MMLRMRDMGTTCGGAGVLDEICAAVVAAAGVTVDGVAGTKSGVGTGGTVAADPRVSIKLSTSSLVIRPSEPVPGTWARSRWFSLAILRTSGDERMRSRSNDGPDSAGAAGAGSDAGEGGAAARASVAADAEVGAWVVGAPSGWATGASPPITATTVFTWTVAPSGTLISLSTPDTGAGISASTLSVEISNSGSSLRTASPAFLSHLVIVPSKIDSPICGMMTSVLEEDGAGSDEAAIAWGCLSSRSAAADFTDCGRLGLNEAAASDSCSFVAVDPSTMTATTVFTSTVVP